MRFFQGYDLLPKAVSFLREQEVGKGRGKRTRMHARQIQREHRGGWQKLKPSPCQPSGLSTVPAQCPAPLLQSSAAASWQPPGKAEKAVVRFASHLEARRAVGAWCAARLLDSTGAAP